MKRVISIICVMGILVMPCAFMVSSDTQSQTGVVVYQQWNNGSITLASQSPNFYGDINSGNTLYPINYVGQITSIASGTVYPDTITVDISNDLIRRGECTVYLGIYNCWTIFMGSTDYNLYFEWLDSVPGYRYKGNVSTTMGFAQTTSISANTPSSPSVAVRRMAAGASGGSSIGNVTPFASRTPNQHYVTHEASNGNSSNPSWVVASNSYNLYKVNLDSVSDERDTLRFTLDSNDITSCTCSQSISGNHLISGVFVPIALVVDTSNYDDTLMSKLDDIIDSLADLNQNITDSTYDIVSILNTNFASIIASIGTSNGPRDNMLYYLNSIMSYLGMIQVAIGHQSVDPTSFSSAIQYIEYYLKNVLADTNRIVDYLDTIASTLANIAAALDAANDQMDDINQDQEGIHDYEQGIYDDTNNYIGSEVIQGFELIEGVATGQARVALDFTNFWNSLYPWNQIYTFAMMMTLSLTIIRYSSAKSRSKDNNKKKGGKEGG